MTFYSVPFDYLSTGFEDLKDPYLCDTLLLLVLNGRYFDDFVSVFTTDRGYAGRSDHSLFYEEGGCRFFQNNFHVFFRILITFIFQK